MSIGGPVAAAAAAAAAAALPLADTRRRPAPSQQRRRRRRRASAHNPAVGGPPSLPAPPFDITLTYTVKRSITLHKTQAADQRTPTCIWWKTESACSSWGTPGAPSTSFLHSAQASEGTSVGGDRRPAPRACLHARLGDADPYLPPCMHACACLHARLGDATPADGCRSILPGACLRPLLWRTVTHRGLASPLP